VVVGKAFPGSVGVRALWVGSDPGQHNMVVRNNTVKVETMTDDIATAFNDPGYSFSCVEFQGQDPAQPHPPVLFQNNTLITNLIFIAVGSGYGVGSAGYFYDTTFQKIDHNTTFFTPFRIGYWTWSSYGVKVIDSLAGAGVDLRAPVPNVAGDTAVHLSLDFGISSTRVYAKADGTPLANTTVAWRTDGGEQGSFVTDGKGQASNEWMTTRNLHAVGAPGGTMTQVQNRTITFTVAGYDPVTKNLGDVQKTGPAIVFGAGVVTPGCVAGTPTYPAVRFVLGADMNGDGRGEVLVVDSKGVLWAIPGMATGGLGQACQLGVGFGKIQVFGPGDINSDGRADLITLTPDGNLWMYRGNGMGPVSAPPTQIGWSWTGWRLVPVGDINGDKKPDLLGVNPSGMLYHYFGSGDSAGHFGTAGLCGSGWTGLNLYAGGDLNADGRSDILAVNPTAGWLYRYLGIGQGLFAPSVLAGSGWNVYTLASGADLNGDGLADIIGRNDKTGGLFFYKGQGTSGPSMFAPAIQIGTGW